MNSRNHNEQRQPSNEPSKTATLETANASYRALQEKTIRDREMNEEHRKKILETEERIRLLELKRSDLRVGRTAHYPSEV